MSLSAFRKVLEDHGFEIVSDNKDGLAGEWIGESLLRELYEAALVAGKQGE